MFWNKEVETMPRTELERLQSERLRKVVEYVYHNVPFYKKKLDEAGIKPEDIRGIQDLPKLPFTTRDDLRENYPFGMFAVPLEDIVRIHASSGTTGKPTVVGYTVEDIELWAEVMARALAAGGVTSQDVVQISYGYGLFTGGLGFHYGAEKIGATVVPASSGNTKRQIMLMQDFGATALCCTPSYSLFMAEVAKEEGIEPASTKLKVAFLGAEPWSEEMRRKIEEAWGILALDQYGLSEIIGPGVSYECPQKNGLHINEDVFLPEVIDPQTGEPLPPGEKGELVLTTLTKKGMPVIRYRTRDITRLYYEPCGCGRTFVRMEKVTGRTDDMIIVKGVNVFPSQIEEVLMKVEGTLPHYLIVLTREKGLDVMEIWVEVEESIFADEMKRLEQMEEKIKSELESVLGLSAKVKLVEPKTIERSMGKAKRVVDKREI